MFKKFPMKHTISQGRFNAILGCFRTIHDRGIDGRARRRGLNEMMHLHRKRYARLLFDIENTMTSLDDDKQRMRSYKCDDEGFVRVRHAKGGFGPVQHVAVSQLTHFVIGAIVNSKGSSDAKTLEHLLYECNHGTQVIGDTNYNGAAFFLDRGYQTDSILKVFDIARCNVLGTIQRQKTAEAFPYTFEHPEYDHNVPNDGIPVALYHRKGVHIALCYRGFQSKKPVLLRSTMPMLTVPRTRTWEPPIEEPQSSSAHSTPEKTQSWPQTLEDVIASFSSDDDDDDGVDIDIGDGITPGSDLESVNSSCVSAYSEGEDEPVRLLDRIPTDEELKSQPTDLYPFVDTYFIEPSKLNLPPSKFVGQMEELNAYCTILTCGQSKDKAWYAMRIR